MTDEIEKGEKFKLMDTPWGKRLVFTGDASDIMGRYWRRLFYTPGDPSRYS